MKRLFMLLVGLNIINNSVAQGIDFIENLSWTQIKEKAKNENKFIFVESYATWCSPCKAMDQDVFSSVDVAKIANGNFVSVKVQMDRNELDNSNIRNWYPDADSIQSKYSVRQLPTYLFFLPNGEIVNRGIGYQNIESFIKLLNNTLVPEGQFYTQVEKFNHGKLSFQEIPKLALKAKELGLGQESKNIARYYIDNYLLRLDKQELFNDENLKFIAGFVGNTTSESFKLFYSKRNEINAVLGDNKAEYCIRSAISRDYLKWEPERKLSTEEWEKLEKTIKNKFGLIGQEVVDGQRMMYYLELKDTFNFAKFYKKYFDSALQRPEYNINSVTWFLFENVENPQILEYACNVVMKYAMEEWYSSYPPAFDTYANLLYKTGKINLAIEWEEKAIKLSKGKPQWEPVFTEVLIKMKKGEVIVPDTLNN